MMVADIIKFVKEFLSNRFDFCSQQGCLLRGGTLVWAQTGIGT